MTIKPADNAGVVIVLGCKVNGGVPSLSLRYRLEKALEFLESHESAVAVVSGGQGADETRIEAEVMAEWLIKRGISPERIIAEGESRSTKENIANSKRLIEERLGRLPPAVPVVIVTNDYHVFRSILLARKAGLNAGGLAAKTPTGTIAKSYIRECGAIVKMILGRP